MIDPATLVLLTDLFPEELREAIGYQDYLEELRCAKEETEAETGE